MKIDWLDPGTRDYMEQTAPTRTALRARYVSFHQDTVDYVQALVDSRSKVLVIGYQLEPFFTSLRCGWLGLLDLDPGAPPLESSPLLSVYENLDQARSTAPYDVVVLPFTLQFVNDIQAFLVALAPLLQSSSRVVTIQHNFLWAPLVKIAQRLSLRTPLPDLNWLNLDDIRNLMRLTHYEEVTAGARCLFPFGQGAFTSLLNRVVAPLVPVLCQKTCMVVRPMPQATKAASVSVSLVVPARNEAGNIAALLDRLPILGSAMEVIFVEGHSRDDTWPEIQRQLTTHARRSQMSLKAYQQPGVGKADAVRFGFSKATGEMLIILDADLSVPPEELLHCYNGLVEGVGEFMNGSRLVYQMERYAMFLLNLFFNKVFGLWISWLIGQRVKDTLCGTKALFRRDYLRLQARSVSGDDRDPFGDFELLFGASLLGLKICDVPVHYRERTYGQTNIRRFRHGWQLVRFCLAAWRRRP